MNEEKARRASTQTLPNTSKLLHIKIPKPVSLGCAEHCNIEAGVAGVLEQAGTSFSKEAGKQQGEAAKAEAEFYRFSRSRLITVSARDNLSSFPLISSRQRHELGGRRSYRGDHEWDPWIDGPRGIKSECGMFSPQYYLCLATVTNHSILLVLRTWEDWDRVAPSGKIADHTYPPTAKCRSKSRDDDRVAGSRKRSSAAGTVLRYKHSQLLANGSIKGWLIFVTAFFLHLALL